MIKKLVKYLLPLCILLPLLGGQTLPAAHIHEASTTISSQAEINKSVQSNVEIVQHASLAIIKPAPFHPTKGSNKSEFPIIEESEKENENKQDASEEFLQIRKSFSVSCLSVGIPVYEHFSYSLTCRPIYLILQVFRL